MEAMKNSSPWVAVALVIAGMIVGYVVQIHRFGATTASASYSCPYKAACANGNCDKKDCSNGTCKGDCPGCKGGAQS